MNKKVLTRAEKPVIQYTLEGEFVKEYKNTKSAMSKTGIGGLYNCCIKNQKTSGGFIWKYKNDGEKTI